MLFHISRSISWNRIDQFLAGSECLADYLTKTDISCTLNIEGYGLEFFIIHLSVCQNRVINSGVHDVPEAVAVLFLIGMP